MRAKVSDWLGLCLRTSAKWADFVAQSLHWKLPFPTQVRDWFDDWVVGSQFRSLPSPPPSRLFELGLSEIALAF
jgi:hypothetical protein